MALAMHVRALSALPQLRVSILTNVELVGVPGTFKACEGGCDR